MAVTSSPQHAPFMPRAQRWARRNLFSSAFNTVLTLLAVIVLGSIIYIAGRFVFIQADWNAIETNRRLLFIGRFPADQEWRLWPPVYLSAALAGTAVGIWMSVSRRDLAWMVAVAAFVFVFLARGSTALLLAGAIVVGIAAYLLAARVLTDGPGARLLRRALTFGAIALIPFTLIILKVAGGPSTELWGGYYTNALIALVAITFSLPLGILLALARRSSIRTLRYPATVFIELVRAGPLVVWLFISRFVLPDFLPPIPGMDLLTRVIIMFTIFTAAYVAEIVRGGLQSVPRGQIEAGEALGMGTFSITVYIVLPQALRTVLPALVGQMIALWKDTSLVFIVGLFDFLRAGNVALSQPEFTSQQQEVYLFVGLGFWIVAFAMSRLSRRVEQSLGVGSH